MEKYLKNNALNIAIALPFVFALLIAVGLPAYIWLVVSVLSILFSIFVTYKPAKKFKKLTYWLFGSLSLVFGVVLAFDWWLELSTAVDFIEIIGQDGTTLLLNGTDLWIYSYVVPLLAILGDAILLNVTRK